MAASVCFDDAVHRLHRPPCHPTSDFAQMRILFPDDALERIRTARACSIEKPAQAPPFALCCAAIRACRPASRRRSQLLLLASRVISRCALAERSRKTTSSFRGRGSGGWPDAQPIASQSKEERRTQTPHLPFRGCCLLCAVSSAPLSRKEPVVMERIATGSAGGSPA